MHQRPLRRQGRSTKNTQSPVTVASVFASWPLARTEFTVKYARLYYCGRGGGIDFNEAEPRNTPTSPTWP